MSAIYILLSLALGPSLQINIAEPIIFAILLTFTWLSFAIGVRSSKIITQPTGTYEQEWKEEEYDLTWEEGAANSLKKGRKHLYALHTEMKRILCTHACTRR